MQRCKHDTGRNNSPSTTCTVSVLKPGSMKWDDKCTNNHIWSITVMSDDTISWQPWLSECPTFGSLRPLPGTSVKFSPVTRFFSKWPLQGSHFFSIIRGSSKAPNVIILSHRERMSNIRIATTPAGYQCKIFPCHPVLFKMATTRLTFFTHPTRSHYTGLISAGLISGHYYYLYNCIFVSASHITYLMLY